MKIFQFIVSNECGNVSCFIPLKKYLANRLLAKIRSNLSHNYHPTKKEKACCWKQ